MLLSPAAARVLPSAAKASSLRIPNSRSTRSTVNIWLPNGKPDWGMILTPEPTGGGFGVAFADPPFAGGSPLTSRTMHIGKALLTEQWGVCDALGGGTHGTD